MIDTDKLDTFTALLNKTIDRFQGLAESKALGEELGSGSPLESAHEGVDELINMYKQAITKESK